MHRNPSMSLAQFHETPAHSYQNYQAMIRLSVKLRYLVGLAHRITEVIGTTNFPQVRDTLGELASDAGMIDAYVHAMEAKGSYFGPYFVPDKATLYSCQVKAQKLYPKVIETIRELAGGGMIMLPSSAEDFANPEARAIIEKTMLSPATDPEGRVKAVQARVGQRGIGVRVAAHAVRDVYSGARHFVTGHAYRTYDWGARDRPRRPRAQ